MLTCKFISAWWDVWLTTKTSQNRTGRFDVFEVQGECITGCDQALLKMVWLFLGNRYVTPYVRI